MNTVENGIMSNIFAISFSIKFKKFQQERIFILNNCKTYSYLKTIFDSVEFAYIYIYIYINAWCNQI